MTRGPRVLLRLLVALRRARRRRRPLPGLAIEPPPRRHRDPDGREYVVCPRCGRKTYNIIFPSARLRGLYVCEECYRREGGKDLKEA